MHQNFDLDSACEYAVVLLTSAILIIAPLSFGAVQPLPFGVIQGLVAAILLVWLFRIGLNQKRRLFWPPLNWFILSFLFYASAYYPMADLKYIACQEVMRVLTYGLLFLAIVDNVRERSHLQGLALVLVFLAMLIAAYAIYQFATESNHVWYVVRPEQYAGRGSGTYICPNHLAGFLGMVLPVGIGMVLFGRQNHLLRIFVGYACVVILAGIGVTLSRGGWLATGIALSCFLLLMPGRWSHRLVILTLLVIALGASILLVKHSDLARERLNLAGKHSQPTTLVTRLGIWKPAVKMWLDHPVFGVGPGHFDYVFPAYRSVHIQRRPGYVHNDYLNLLVDWGIVGGAIIASACACAILGLRDVLRYLRPRSDGIGRVGGQRAGLVIGCTVGLSTIAIHSLGDFNLHIPANAITATALLAIITAHLRFTSKAYWVSLPTWRRVFLGMGLLLASGTLGYQATRTFSEQTWLRRAAKENHYTEDRLIALKNAFALEPANFETAYEIGESLRQVSWQGGPDYIGQATEAIEWFQTAAKLNPFDASSEVRTGMCFDWLGQGGDAIQHYDRALELDPMNYYLVALRGWHFAQVGNYREAKKWLERSLEIRSWENSFSHVYLRLVNRRLAEEEAIQPPRTESIDPRNL